MDSTASAGAGNSLDKPRLTDQEKKNNHIASEQKRRQAIREGFDEIADIVPGLKGQGRSEALVLEGATAHIRKLLSERHHLVLQAQESGVDCGAWELDDISRTLARQAAEDEDGTKKSKR